MILVNLIRVGKGGELVSPVNVSAGAEAGALGGDQIQKEAMKRLLLIFVGPLLLYVYYNYSEFPDVRQRLGERAKVVADLRNQNDKAKAAVNSIKKYEEDQKSTQIKIDVIQKLKLGRATEVKVLDVIQKGIPDKAWISKMEFRDGRLNLSGVALTAEDVSLFEDQLRKSIFLKEVSTGRVSEVTLEKGTIGKSFAISAALEGDIKEDMSGK